MGHVIWGLRTEFPTLYEKEIPRVFPEKVPKFHEEVVLAQPTVIVWRGV